MKYRMRMLAAHLATLRDLLGDTSREQACFLLVSPAQGDDETVLLVRDVIPLKPEDYRIQKSDFISVEPIAMVRAVKLARQADCAICMVHTHPMCNGAVGFSRADDIGNEDSFAFFQRMLPNKPHSCLVWDGAIKNVEGRVYSSPTEWTSISNLTVVDDAQFLRMDNGQTERSQIDTQFDRQARLLGADGQRLIGQLRVAIIGCGGIGSATAMVLAHAGVRNFELIDFDFIEKSNLPRIVGACLDDVKHKRYKVDVMKRYIEALCPEASVRVHMMQVEQRCILKTLVSADLLVCGTDDSTSRAYLNQVCHQYLVPILDMGVQFGVDATSGQLTKEVGRVHLMLPGKVCMCCTGHVQPQMLTQEGLSVNELADRVREGYFYQHDVPEPSTMIFNMQVAGLGAQRVIEWITGLSEVISDHFEQFRFFGLCGPKGVKLMRKRTSGNCYFCGAVPKLLGAGNGQTLFVLPRPLINTKDK
jgi:ThiF family